MKILVLSCPTGGGHDACAKYIAKAFHNKKIECDVKNYLEVIGEKTSNLVRPRFKRDHKSQKRIQCAINNKDFYQKICGGVFDELYSYEKVRTEK